MIGFILNWIDKVIMIFVALLLLRYYYNPKVSRLYKKKWALLVCGFLLFYSIFDLVVAYRDYSSSRFPTSKEIKKTILSEGTILTEDVTYSSPDGYQILIPAGYTYIKGQSGGLSFSAVKEGAALAILKMSGSKPLDKLGSDIIEGLEKADSQFILHSSKSFSFKDADALRLEWELVRRGVAVDTIMILVKRGRTFFQLHLSSRKEISEQSSPEFERIIKSFMIK